MKTVEFKIHTAQKEHSVSDWDGIECWSSRELQLGELIGNHFPDVRKMVIFSSDSEIDFAHAYFALQPQALPPAEDVKKVGKK